MIYHLLTQENIITMTMVWSALSMCLLCAKDMSHHHTEWHQQTCKVTLGIRWEKWAFKNLTMYLGLYLVADLILKFGLYSSKTTIFLECCMTTHPLRGCLTCYFPGSDPMENLKLLYPVCNGRRVTSRVLWPTVQSRLLGHEVMDKIMEPLRNSGNLSLQCL